MVGAEISAAGGITRGGINGSTAPPSEESAALAHRFKQADAGGDRHVQ